MNNLYCSSLGHSRIYISFTCISLIVDLKGSSMNFMLVLANIAILRADNSSQNQTDKDL